MASRVYYLNMAPGNQKERGGKFFLCYFIKLGIKYIKTYLVPINWIGMLCISYACPYKKVPPQKRVLYIIIIYILVIGLYPPAIHYVKLYLCYSIFYYLLNKL